MSESGSSRRDLFKSLKQIASGGGARSADRPDQADPGLPGQRPAGQSSGRQSSGGRLSGGETSAGSITPVGGDTIRVSCRAMACEFTVIMNPGKPAQLTPASQTLQMIHDIELWLSSYRDNSELSFVNRTASAEAVHIRRPFVELLQRSVEIWQQTQGAFDIAAGALVRLWRDARAQQRIPTPEEVERVREHSGTSWLQIDDVANTVRFLRTGLQLDPGAIGKGYALDEVSHWLQQTPGAPEEYLVHGGHSSLIARGTHNQLAGWPVGIGNPLFTDRRLATLVLRDQAMSTSGSNIQYFRFEGRRYGHILDPRTGWPVEGMLSVTVLAESAAVADAVSTAFFVLGVEKALQCCEKLDNIGVILVPFPVQSRKLRPVVAGIPDEQIFWDETQVDVV